VEGPGQKILGSNPGRQSWAKVLGNKRCKQKAPAAGFASPAKWPWPRLTIGGAVPLRHGGTV